ncbi:unnamed protein product [Durusdinium trenchii]|uniref:Uncharacterized protein n=1 Tax=Durusdinium trenchii TaxID=1381693 RepID=A0ABP0LSH2_9DINO|eukprot:g1498.t1
MSTAPSEADLQSKLKEMKKVETKEDHALDTKMLENLEKVFANCGGDAAAIAGKTGLSADLIKSKATDAKSFAKLACQGLLSAD